ncbi:hypothetical protein SASPL_141109 [Salvia splendens]|uniref:Uncharacterized protein n=1 Tax=Salvia splendens TaxID=180675 RepID=A0A8X8ZCJ5_SALSN|nr:hypothetical protein SASPL_141109 [Salvia splendens]
MLNAVKLARSLHQKSLTSFPLPNANHIAPSSAIRFVSIKMESHKQKQREPDSNKQTDSESKSVESMSSFGEGYATRSDEEGFGGIYGGNQYVSKDGEEKDFEHNQGSHVKEKEKARHQTSAD